MNEKIKDMCEQIIRHAKDNEPCQVEELVNVLLAELEKPICETCGGGGEVESEEFDADNNLYPVTIPCGCQKPYYIGESNDMLKPEPAGEAMEFVAKCRKYYPKDVSFMPTVFDDVHKLCDIITQKEKEIERLKFALEHIKEYWCGSINRMTMFDALQKIEMIAEKALKAGE